MLSDLHQKRFNELDGQFGKIIFVNQYGGVAYSRNGAWAQWTTSAQHLILSVCGENSSYYSQFTRALDQCSGAEESLKKLYAIFRSAKDDFESGYIFNTDLRISGEVFGDFVTLAKQSIQEGHKDVAAVLACAALEDALKKFAAVNDLDVQNKTMQEVVNALKSKGLVSGAQKTLLDSMPKIRDCAMHADWGKLDSPTVNGVIGFVEQFLLSKFSNG